jgi:immune inhibitor A
MSAKRRSVLFSPMVTVGVLLIVALAFGNPPVDKKQVKGAASGGVAVDKGSGVTHKEIDQPNMKDFRKLRQRQRLLQSGKDGMLTGDMFTTAAKIGIDTVLVILVEFAGTDTFTWTKGESTWDPLGKADSAEWAGSIGDCSNIDAATQDFTYTGPLHNQIARPLSAEDRSGDMIWTPDFSADYYRNIIFGKGVTFKYTRSEDGSVVNQKFSGKSVNNYYRDMSKNVYQITGDVVGWLQVPHSVWWYGADPCPGARSGGTGHNGAISGAGSARTLVTDALEAVKRAYPTFDWAKYDQDGDGEIDRLWIIHAGLGEEDSTTLLNRTNYGEGGLWSHSSSLSPAYEVVPGIYAGPYIMMPENSGIGVLAHEFGHNIGTDDFYAYGQGETSAGFWTLMADDWTGYPIGFQPPALDPYHLDFLGWLNPYVVSDSSMIHTVTVVQTSKSSGSGYRGVKIPLPDGAVPLPVQPIGSFQWWGGKEKLTNAMMTKKTAVSIPAGGATLSFNLAYAIEQGWDFLWVQVSTDNGATWSTLTNGNTLCTHAGSWIGGLFGFPDDLCSAGIGGFTGTSSGYPSYGTETFSLNAFANKDILLRFWYMTDWNTQLEGPFIDNIIITSGETLFSDNAENGDDNWTYADGWSRNDGNETFTHNYYLQFRNVTSSGGYDSALGDSRWRFGPANSGLLVWYNNNFYQDNEIFNYMNNAFGFGPKGRMLVVDAHPEPYRDPYYVAQGYNNEGANVNTRSLMRDAPFSLFDSVGFTMKAPDWVYEDTLFEGRPAVSLFDDSLGYYAGAELVKAGPAYRELEIWDTVQWDASVAIPSTIHYGINAPGYTDGTRFYYYCYRATEGRLSCYRYDTGLGYDGGTGNPGDVGGQYGWKVKLMKQKPNSATVKIWNSRYAVAPDLNGEWVDLGQSCVPTSGGEKCQINGNFKVLNTGAVDAGSSQVYLYLSEDGSYDKADRLLKKLKIKPLLAGGEATAKVTYVFPAGLNADDKYVIAVIDPLDKVAESHEDNNETAYHVVVVP